MATESKGSYADSPGLILTSLALGGGYDIYDLATSNFSVNNTTEPDQTDHGIYTWDLQGEEFTPPTRNLIKGLAAARIDIVKVKPENFAAFNTSDNQPKDKLEQLIYTAGAQITFQTNSASLGFVLGMRNYLLIYSLNDSQFKLKSDRFGKTISGRYDVDGTFTKEGTTALENQTLHVKGGVLYRINAERKSKVDDNAAKMQSTKWLDV